MKVPGFGELIQRSGPFVAPLPPDNRSPFIEMAFDAFGPRRLMWMSNFPAVGEGYRNALRLPMEHVQFKTKEDQDWLFGKTAATLFRFGV